MDCPRDRVAMQAQTSWKNPRHRCGTCGGIFLTPAHIDETLGERIATGLATRLRGEVETADGVRSIELPASKLCCPDDGTRMCVLRYKGVEIDGCPKCRAVWLDAGECARIAEVKPVDVPRSARVDPSKVSDMLGALQDYLERAAERS